MATLEPYDPQFSDHGIPAEQVRFTVGGPPALSAHLSLHRILAVFHSCRQEEATSMGSGASASRSVGVRVTGDNSDGHSPGAHVVCLVDGVASG
jgi:hypothetical protein